MKAQEVLRRYAAGDRNFCNANLRGANFKGKDLSGADFSGSDIRSANFADATLHEVNFSKVQAGLQKRWKVLQLILVAIVSGLTGFLQAFVGSVTISIFDGTMDGSIAGCVMIFVLLVVYIAIPLQGFTIRAFFSILSAVTGAVTIAGTFLFAGAFAVIFVGAGAGAFAVAFIIMFTGTGAVTSAVTVAVAVNVTFIVTVAAAGADVVAFAFAFAGFLLSVYMGWRVLQEDEKFDTVRGFGLVIASIGGTSFCGADLTGSTFQQARLNSTTFADSHQRKTILKHVFWKETDCLNRARLGSSILKDRRVRSILTTPEKGYKQDLSEANLQCANLNGVTLEESNLNGAILNGALLKGTMLRDAVLTKAQAINADFTGACLTGSTIESWNIDSTTIFNNIDCDYVYLLEHPRENDDRERRPHDIKQMFQPGDFEKLFKEVQDDVQLLIRNGANPMALRAAFQKIRENYPDLPEDAFQGFQRRDEDFLVTVKVPQSIDKGQFQRDWDTGYQAGLQAGREESAALLASEEKRADGLEAIALTMAQHPSTQNTTHNDYRHTIEVQGNVTESVIGQGDSNDLSNTAIPNPEDRTS